MTEEIIKSLREAEALELVEDTGDAWKTKVVPDRLANDAADEIVKLRDQLSKLKSKLCKKCATK